LAGLPEVSESRDRVGLGEEAEEVVRIEPLRFAVVIDRVARLALSQFAVAE
jgi:hypothetical protein